MGVEKFAFLGLFSLGFDCFFGAWIVFWFSTCGDILELEVI